MPRARAISVGYYIFAFRRWELYLHFMVVFHKTVWARPRQLVAVLFDSAYYFWARADLKWWHFCFAPAVCINCVVNRPWTVVTRSWGVTAAHSYSLVLRGSWCKVSKCVIWGRSWPINCPIQSISSTTSNYCSRASLQGTIEVIEPIRCRPRPVSWAIAHFFSATFTHSNALTWFLSEVNALHDIIRANSRSCHFQFP